MAANSSRNPGQVGPRRTRVSRLAAGLDRLAGRPIVSEIEGAVRRFLQPQPSPPLPLSAVQAQDPGLQRARTALTAARTQMPGLLSGNSPGSGVVPAAAGSGGTALEALLTQSSAPAFEFSSGMGGLARLEEAILRLDDERRQLSAEVAALRLTVGELRETLLQLDERESYRGRQDSGWHEPTEVAPIPPPQIEPVAAPAATEGPAEAAQETDQREAATEQQRSDEAGQQSQAEDMGEPVAATEAGVIYPSGSVGVCLRIASVAGPVALDAIHRSLTAMPEVDAVRLLSYADGLAEFRIYLRQPLARARLVASVAAAGPRLRIEDDAGNQDSGLRTE